MFGGNSSSSHNNPDSTSAPQVESDQNTEPPAADSSHASGAVADGGSSSSTTRPASATGARGSGFDVDSIPEEAVVSDHHSLPSTTTDKRHNTISVSNVTSDVPMAEKKRRSSGVSSKASSLLASARNSFSFGSSGKGGGGGGGSSDPDTRETPFQKLGKRDPALAVPQGQHNNSAGESAPGPKSTFRVGVWEDRNKKCRRTMEDTHAFLYNFLPTPAPAVGGSGGSGSIQDVTKPRQDDTATTSEGAGGSPPVMIETDNGYFAIFDGHAGSFAADWCGKKLHVILEDVIRKHPNVPIPELLDMTFTSVDAQLEKLPSKSSGCTAAIAVLRWEDRVPNERSATGSQSIAPVAAKVAASTMATSKGPDVSPTIATTASVTTATTSTTQATTTSDTPPASPGDVVARLRSSAARQRVLYTANVGDARIILCRNGKALRLSYDHKGSDENEGKRIANAGGLIVNNRVNGVLAVTRALGDAYMKDLVTGHPYTTETVIVPDTDEFIIIACDGLWDVCTDQEAVDLIRTVEDPFAASKLLVDHALSRFSTDNLSCMVVRLNRAVFAEQQSKREQRAGVEGDAADGTSPRAQQTEVDKIVGEAQRKMEGLPGQASVVSSDSSSGGSCAIVDDDDGPSKEDYEAQKDDKEAEGKGKDKIADQTAEA